jgi:GNAT superfamily N-acetyltransferase
VSRRSRLPTWLRPDYLLAVALWAFGRVSGLQFHRVLVAPARSPSLHTDEAFRHHRIADRPVLDHLGGDVELQLDEQSGPSCRTLLARGHRIHALLADRTVACQLNVCLGEFDIDSPALLRLALADGTGFVGFLHTRDRFRGHGLAARLIEAAIDNERAAGVERFMAHVRATNFTSMMAFRRAGWQPKAWIVSTRSGRFLGAPGCRRIGLRISRREQRA